MRRKVRPRTKMVPFRMYVLLLWGAFIWLDRKGTSVELSTRGLARMLGLRASRVWEYFEFLQRFGYIRDLRKVTRGRTAFEFVRPKIWGGEP